MNHVQLTYLNPSFRSFFIAVLFLSSPLPGAIDVGPIAVSFHYRLPGPAFEPQSQCEPALNPMTGFVAQYPMTEHLLVLADSPLSV
jgi:hypothetical protein